MIETTKIKNFRELEVWKLGKKLDLITKDKNIEALDHEQRMLKNLIKKL